MQQDFTMSKAKIYGTYIKGNSISQISFSILYVYISPILYCLLNMKGSVTRTGILGAHSLEKKKLK